jgi:CRP-like cAMP-binding protein
MADFPDPRRNHLLAALPDTDYQRWLAHVEPVDLPLGLVLHESGSTLSHLYFPTTAVLTLLYELENGTSAQLALVGREGVVGIALFLGGESTISNAVVQNAGAGVRIDAQTIKDEFSRGGAPMHLLLRYTQALITQMSQTAVCNRRHSLDKQLCRWLLLTLDRLPANEIMMTQELIATMLGVRRESITESAYKLERAGVIHYARGHIHVLDRPGLEKRTCECYEVVKKEYARLLPRALAP